MLKLAEQNAVERSGKDIALAPSKGEAVRLVAAIRRQASMVVFGCVLGLVFGTGYILTAVPQFTGTAVLLLDNRRVRAVQDAYDTAPVTLDATASAVDSQIEVLKSDSVALTVVDKLQLLRNPEFTRPRSGL